MFELTISDIDMLKNSVGIAAEIIDEGIFRISKNGLRFVAADRALVAVVDLKIGAAAFEKLEVTEDASVGVNMNNFVSVLRRAGTGDRITLKKEDNRNRLKVLITGSSTRRFEVPVLDMAESELPPTDKLEFSSSVELKSDVLAQGIADAEIVSDVVIFEASADGFKIKSEGDSNTTELELEKGNSMITKLEATAAVKSGYPLDYLKKIVKASKLADTANIRFSSEFPMKMEFYNGDKFSMSFVLAPHMIE
ncbi:MAG: proliferating cell nuclear antigen (pcna) [Candidatus Aenigmarchaeota archaeon]|nr:proliferating cell nuclear antigen (pcna) [Candidatus Aenigmarchaeota archaeon]